MDRRRHVRGGRHPSRTRPVAPIAVGSSVNGPVRHAPNLVSFRVRVTPRHGALESRARRDASGRRTTPFTRTGMISEMICTAGLFDDYSGTNHPPPRRGVRHRRGERGRLSMREHQAARAVIRQTLRRVTRMATSLPVAVPASRVLAIARDPSHAPPSDTPPVNGGNRGAMRSGTPNPPRDQRLSTGVNRACPSSRSTPAFTAPTLRSRPPWQGRRHQRRLHAVVPTPSNAALPPTSRGVDDEW